MDGIESALPISEAIESEKPNAKYSIAAYIMAFGSAHMAAPGALDLFVPREDLEGINATGIIQLLLNFRESFSQEVGQRIVSIGPLMEFEERDNIDSAIKGIIFDIENGEGSSPLISSLIENGLKSMDPLIRIASLSTAMKVADHSRLYLPQRFSWFFNRMDSLDVYTRGILSVLVPQWILGTGNPNPALALSAAPQNPSKTVSGTSLLLVHGTHLPFKSDPDWHIPTSGDLFSYLSAKGKMPYSLQDYFEWEGNWTFRGRNIAARNLKNWIESRKLSSPNCVAHSHGCNVVMRSAMYGASYDTVIFASCPVWWSTYNTLSQKIKNPRSIRVKWDYVIMADGGAQRFPPGCGVKEQTLPGTYFGHDASRLSKTWKKHKLDDFL